MIKGEMQIERHMYYDVIIMNYVTEENGTTLDYYVNPRRDEGSKELVYVYSVYEKKGGFYRGNEKLTSEEQQEWSELIHGECKAPYCDEDCDNCDLDVCPFAEDEED